MQLKKVDYIVESILFASGEAMDPQKIAQVLNCEPAGALEILERLRSYYDKRGGGLQILEMDGQFQLCTRKEMSPYIRSALELRRNQPLSQAAMEVLAIIAYNQPVTKSFVEQVRGVDSSSVVNTLVEKGLVEESGRLDLPGKPVAYATTYHFLRCFGLGSLRELPPLPQEDPVPGEAD